ncbi:DYS-1 protein [Aphelenchoides avenae]|nr:DYS-1 protein [Aphelenchus avenae]
MERREDRVEYALTIAKKHFKAPKLILPKEFTSDRLDQKSCVCYLMTLYLALVTLSSSSEPFHVLTRSSIAHGLGSKRYTFTGAKHVNSDNGGTVVIDTTFRDAVRNRNSGRARTEVSKILQFKSEVVKKQALV